VPASALPGFKLVFDAVYTPLETRLLREAAAAGAIAVNGVDMFVGQAAEQFALFTGNTAPVPLMRKTLMASLGL
jgi:3-dehydroquinate dehydratase/shikimate dehydrogenase